MKNIILVLLFINSIPAFADLNIFSCEPEWASLSQELGGDKVSVYSATNGLQDPHHIQARPSLVAHARQANLLICTGAQLEVGWLPLLLRKSGNSAIQVGTPGYFMAANNVRLAEVPKVLDRSQGHIHAAGNPHIQTSPANILRVAKALTQRLQTIDGANASYYQQRGDDFVTRWQAAIKKWQKEAAPLKGTPIIVRHEAWVYLLKWLGLHRVAVLEPKPAVPPSIKDLNNVLNQLKITPAKMVIKAAYESGRSVDWLVNKTGMAKVVLPFTVGGDKESNNLFSLFDDTIQRLLAANK